METHIRVTYTLIDLATGATIKSAVEPIEVTYASTNQPYAGVAAQEDAEQRGADEAADRITSIWLSSSFANRAKP